jgi:hypothetical protein
MYLINAVWFEETDVEVYWTVYYKNSTANEVNDFDACLPAAAVALPDYL